MQDTKNTTIPPSSSRRSLISWAFYDWANNGFSTIILTFIFAAYFTRQVAPDEITGSTWWGIMVGIAGVMTALGGPLLGATADQSGRRKPWLALFTFVCVIATMLLWFIKPGGDYFIPALILVGVGILGAEYGMIFYNAMLPELAPRDRIGRWSGWGWGLGYAGGLLCLVFSLLIINSISGSQAGTATNIRATFVLSGCWYLLFALPLFFFVPETYGRGKRFIPAVRSGISHLVDSFRHIRSYSSIVRFLIARMIYIDGLATIFAFGGVYAAGTFTMDEKEILFFGIALNVTAGLGAAFFSWVDDSIGPKKTILVSLLGLITSGTTILLVESVLYFWIAGSILGIFVGPVQAASRSYLARVAPWQMRNQMFGLYAFSGKVTSFLGPFLVGWLTFVSGSQKIGMSVVVVLLITGMLVMLTVPEAD